MSNEEFTPTTSQVQNGFAMYQLHANNDGDGYEEFDRWLADHDRQVSEKARRDALEEAAVRVSALLTRFYDYDFGTFAEDGWRFVRDAAAFFGLAGTCESCGISIHLETGDVGGSEVTIWEHDEAPATDHDPTPAVTPTESNPTPKEKDL